MTPDSAGADYLHRFHGERAGITQDVLVHALDASGRTPYDWLADAVPAAVQLLDLACGNGPVQAHDLLQRALRTPPPPEPDHLEIVVRYRAAVRGAQVGRRPRRRCGGPDGSAAWPPARTGVRQR